MKDILIIYNPGCTKCHQSMQLLEENNCSIETVKYLEGELDEKLLRKALAALKLRPKDVLRTKEEEFTKLNLDIENDEEVIAAILAHPKILERPIVISGDRAVIGRPPENILKLFSLVILFLFMSCSVVPKNKTDFGTDFHMHIHSPPKDYEDDLQFNGERALFAADSVELSRALILSNSYSRNVSEEYAHQENDFVISEAAKHPKKLAGACAVNPLKEWAVREIKRCADRGVKVLKLHFMASGMDLRKEDDYATAKNAIKNAQDNKLSIIVHAHYPRASRPGEIEKLKALIEEFPDTRFVIGHLFGREFELLKTLKHPNFFVEISVVPVWMKTDEQRLELANVMRDVGMEKFIFGSDWPVIHPAETMKAFLQLPLSKSERGMVVFTNAEKLNDLFQVDGVVVGR